MQVLPKHKFNIYIFLLGIAFFTLFFLEYQPITPKEWVFIFTFVGFSFLSDISSIPLPNGDYFTFLTSFLFVLTIMYGPTYLFMVVLLLVVCNYFYSKKLRVHLFNSFQISISAYLSLFVYESLGGVVGALDLANIKAILGFSAAFILFNSTFMTIYLSIIDNTPFLKQFQDLLLGNKEMVLIFGLMFLIGLIMAIMVEASGLVGLIMFSLLLLAITIMFRKYYEMFNHMNELANKDELTGLFNHRYFQTQLKQLINKNTKLSLLIIDIDYFKSYNDFYGHVEGDKILKLVSKIIDGYIGDKGTVCRYGGEEFSIILPNKDEHEAYEIAEGLRHKISNYHFDGQEILPEHQLTVSIGISSFPSIGHNKESLLMTADEALYKVKHTTRNNTFIYSSVVDKIEKEFNLKSEDIGVMRTLKVLLSSLNFKDRYTYGHTERDMEYAEALARKIGLTEEDIKFIRIGSLLHDIGKVEVPTEVLNKKGKLTDDEWAILKNHTIWGEQIIKPIEFLTPILPMIRNHHERYDGRGYPDQLAGENIHLWARILTIVDSYDAMTSNRSYRKRKTVEEAILELNHEAGKQFDPYLVDKFIEVICEKEDVHKNTYDLLVLGQQEVAVTCEEINKEKAL